MRLILLSVIACVAVLFSRTAAAQIPVSVTCRLEKIATAETDSSGKLISGGEDSKGEIVVSSLTSDAPVASGNLGAVNLTVLKRSSDAIWLAEITRTEVAGVLTIFFKSGIVMYTKHEIIHTLTNREALLGFVEIGKCRPFR